MKISVQSSAVIAAPADRVWAILADEFENVGQWASTIVSSTANPAATRVPDGAATAGRACTVPGFGVTDERFTHFEAAARTFTYSVAAEKMPGFVHDLRNTWSVRAVGTGQCEVTSHVTAEATGVMGSLAGPVLRRQLARTISPVLDDLRSYATTGRVSARKERQQVKAASRAA
ncbi:MAG: SRPBCC family protein [Mycobacteriales bacterium]